MGVVQASVSRAVPLSWVMTSGSLVPSSMYSLSMQSFSLWVPLDAEAALALALDDDAFFAQRRRKPAIKAIIMTAPVLMIPVKMASVGVNSNPARRPAPPPLACISAGRRATTASPVASIKTESLAPCAFTAVTCRSVPTAGMTAMLPNRLLLLFAALWRREVLPSTMEPSSKMKMLFALLLDAFQLCVLGVSEDRGGGGGGRGISPLPDDDPPPAALPTCKANRGDDDVKLAMSVRVLMSKTCILKCWGMPPSYPSLQSISNDDVVWLAIEQLFGGSGTPMSNK